MTQIKYLTDSGRDLVDEHDEFGTREEVESLSEELESHCDTISVDDADINFSALEEAIERATAVFDPDNKTERSAMDSMLAPFVHEYYDIPPRIAGRIGVWQYLTLIEFPEYVVTRWLDYGGVKEKLLGNQKDLYSNQFARLWWGAHLTYDPTDNNYFGAHKLYNKQRLANYVLDSEFRRCRPATLAFVEVLNSETTSTIDDVGSKFNQSLSTYQMEARDRDQFESQLEKILNYVK
jgi:hypothetical protein